jgi:acyl dehydratase
VPKSIAAARFFEDFAVGDRLRSSPIRISEETILGFARLYDPQPFHTNPEYARETIFGGLIASGWQILSETFAKSVEDGLLDGGVSSEGLEDLRWLKPVRPGDAVHLEFEVLEAVADDQKSDRGRVVLDVSALNQNNDVVMSYRLRAIVQRRIA